MENGNKELELKLHRLTLAYAQELPTKIQEIGADWLALKSSWQSVLAEEVYRTVHSLSGSSGSYGAMNVHPLARKLENVILAIIRAERAPSRKEIMEVDDLVDKVSEAANLWVSDTLASGRMKEFPGSQQALIDNNTASSVNEGPYIPPQEEESRLKKYRMLYIEDNRANLSLVKQLVHVHWPNAELSGAEDPVTGLALIKSYPFDLVLLDINLPHMSGFQVLARIRENEETRSLPVVAVSANAMPSDIQAGREAGFDEYITKPIQIDSFFKTIDQILLNKMG